MRNLGFFTILFLILSFTLMYGSDIEESPVGYWKTINEETGEVKSIVRIKKSDNILSGKIIKLFPEPGEDPNPVCDECDGERKNQPILGMKFMWGFKGEGEKWQDGKILDPENGNIYNCRLEVIDEGRRMKVFGYIKLLVKIGRTQVWKRTKKPQGIQLD